MCFMLVRRVRLELPDESNFHISLGVALDVAVGDTVAAPEVRVARAALYRGRCRIFHQPAG